jgi:hypothetical protein
MVLRHLARLDVSTLSLLIVLDLVLLLLVMVMLRRLDTEPIVGQ